MPELKPEFFEAAMLACFELSWPFAIAKTIRTRTTQVKSIVFITLTLMGYIAGIVYKLTCQFDYVFWFYATNCFMVLTQLVLYFWLHLPERLRRKKPWGFNLHRSRYGSNASVHADRQMDIQIARQGHEINNALENMYRWDTYW